MDQTQVAGWSCLHCLLKAVKKTIPVKSLIQFTSVCSKKPCVTGFNGFFIGQKYTRIARELCKYQFGWLTGCKILKEKDVSNKATTLHMMINQ